MDPSKTSSAEFMKAVSDRRSIYAINSTSPISDKRIQDLVYETMRHVPSAFNSQSARAVVLFKDEHRRFWAMAKETSLASIPDEGKKAYMAGRLDGFAKGYGSVNFQVHASG